MQVIEGSMWNKVWLKFKEWTIRSVSLLIFWQGDKRHFPGTETKGKDSKLQKRERV